MMTDYKYIRIDMGYCATPVWVSEDLEDGFMNGDFDAIPNIPITLKHVLSCYQNLWENIHSGKSWNCFDTEESDWDTPEMKEYDFALIATSKIDIDGEVIYKIADDLIEAGAEDCTVSSRGNALIIEFDREARSYEEAVMSAIKEVQSLDLLTVKSVDAGQYIGLSDAAEL